MRYLYLVLYILFFLFACYWFNNLKTSCCAATGTGGVIENSDSTAKIAKDSDVKDELVSPSAADDEEKDSDKIAEATASTPKVIIKDNGPILFKWGETKPILSSRFNAYRDSLVTALGSDNDLEIVGRFFGGEEYSGNQNNLGFERASEVKNLFKGLIDEEKFILSSKKLNDREGMNEHPFFASIIRTIRSTKKVVEVDETTTLYFDYNSTQPITDTEIISYIDKLVARIKNTSEKVKLVGHTDSMGNPDANIDLGKWRAQKVENLLVKKGIPASRIITESKGETKPASSNSTKAGRKNNRRVELTII